MDTKVSKGLTQGWIDWGPAATYLQARVHRHRAGGVCTFKSKSPPPGGLFVCWLSGQSAGFCCYRGISKLLVRGTRCGRGCCRTRAVIPIELLHSEDAWAGAVLRLLDLRPVNLHLVADLDAGRVALERVGLSVTGLQLEPAGAGPHASGYDVMAAADLDGDNDRDSDDRTHANSCANNLARRGTNAALALSGGC